MNKKLIPTLATLFGGFLLSAHASAADIDTVYRRGDAKPVAGQITSVTRNEVVVTQKIANREERIPANEITRIDWKGEPIGLSLARGREAAGNVAEAAAAYEEALTAAASAPAYVKADIEFMIARASAKLAQRDPTQSAAALERLQRFISTQREHYQFYPALLLLGETSLATGDLTGAESAFQRLQQAPWPDYQLAGQLGSARAALASDKIAEAQQIFDRVAAATAATPAEKSRQLQARLGQAECLVRTQKTAEASQLLQRVIDEVPVDESRLLAEAYLQLGNSFLGGDPNPKEAVLAYLHVDVIPALAAHSDVHAKALAQLAKLWPLVGHPARGAEAAARLEQEYPNSAAVTP